MSGLKEKLDTIERNKLRKLESTIADGIASFIVVGEALKEIRDAKLYRESYKTFEKYVDEKWGMQKSQAYRLIDASVVSQNLSPIGDKNERVAEIKTESQLRELKDVPVEAIEAVVNKAADIAGDERITASDIKQAREEVLAPEKKPEPTKDVWEDVDDELAAKTSKPLPKTVMSQKPEQLVANIQAVGESLLALIKEMDRLSDQVGGEWIDMQEVETRAKSLRKLIRGFAHWVDCPECNGKGCGGCKKRGWLCVDRKQFLDQRQKDLLGVA